MKKVCVLLMCLLLSTALFTACSKTKDKMEPSILPSVEPTVEPTIIPTPESTMGPGENQFVYEDKDNGFTVYYPNIFTKENMDYISEDTKFFETEDKSASFSITYRKIDNITVEDYKAKIEEDYYEEDATTTLIKDDEVRFINDLGKKIMVLDAIVRDGNVYQWEMYYPKDKISQVEPLYDTIKFILK